MKKGISLVALVITIVVLIILTGTIILSTMNNNIFDNTNSTVNEYNKKVIIEDINMKIREKRIKNEIQGIYTITMEEIIPIIQEHGTFNNNILKLTTTKGIEIWLYEIMEIPLEEYATITYENNILTVQTELTNNGYRVQYTTDAGSSWSLYNNPVTVSEESGIQIRLINEAGQVVSNTLKITGGVIGEVDNISPTITIEPNGIGLAKDTQVTITVTDNNELANNNTYEYYLSTSQDAQTGGRWITYTNGTAFTIGTNLTGTYYLHVKPIYDISGNTSGSVVSQSYTFDNTAPYSFIPTIAEVTANKIIVNASTSDNNGQAVTYQYSIDNGKTWKESNTFTDLTAGTTYSGIQVKAIDSVGNEFITSNITTTTLSDIWDGTIASGFAGGTGTSESPYEIETPSQLALLASVVNTTSSITNPSPDDTNTRTYSYMQTACYILMNDIVLNKNASNYTNWGTSAPANVWTPIGNYSASTSYVFKGTLQGNYHTISGIYINSSSAYNGLVGAIGGSSSSARGGVTNLGVIQSYIKGANYTAGISGVGLNNSYTYSSYFSGIVKSTGTYVGGIFGYSNRSYCGIGNSYNAGNISTTSTTGYIGGISGYLTDCSSISNCYNIGKISGTSGYVGAISGYKDYWDGYYGVSNCYYSTTTSGVSRYTGNNNTYFTNGENGCATFTTAPGTLNATVNSTTNLCTSLNAKTLTDVTWVIKSGINNGYPVFDWQTK